MSLAKIGLYLVLALPVLAGAVYVYMEHVGNPQVTRELLEQPQGERAAKVMLITLPSGRRIPVNYLREDAMVWAGADGVWWKELRDGPHSVTLLIRGETLKASARAVLDDPAYRKEVFAKLRPTALPGFGTLVEMKLETKAGVAGDN